MKCIFCSEESKYERRVPNLGTMAPLCEEHYGTKTMGEVFEQWKKMYGDKRFVCDVCGNRFLTRLALAGHSRTHKRGKDENNIV